MDLKRGILGALCKVRLSFGESVASGAGDGANFPGLCVALGVAPKRRGGGYFRVPDKTSAAPINFVHHFRKKNCLNI